MRILALDLATSTGWACGSPGGTPITFGTVKMPSTGPDIGRFVQVFRDWVNLAIDEMEPTEIVYESPIMPATANLATTRKLYSLGGVLELVARDRGIEISEEHMQEVRVYFLGISRAPKTVPQKERRKWIKDKVVAKCHERGFLVTCDDEGDAVALLDFAIANRSPAHSVGATPLFAHAP